MTLEEFISQSTPSKLWSIHQGIEQNRTMLQQLLDKVDAMAITAQDVLDTVAEVKDRTDAENVLLDKIHDMLLEAQKTGDQALLGQAIDQLGQIKQGAVDAILRNTPDDPSAGGGAVSDGGPAPDGEPAVSEGEPATP